MNERIQLEILGYGCADFGDLVDRVVDQVNLGNIVEYDAVQQLDSSIVMRELIECSKHGEDVNKYLSSLIYVHILYDDDVMVSLYNDDGVMIGKGPWLQLKEHIGFGLSFKF